MSIEDSTAATACSQAIKINGNPKLWSQFLRFYYNIYQLAKKVTNGVPDYPIASMIWQQLNAETQQTIIQPLWTTYSMVGKKQDDINGLSNGVISATSTSAVLDPTAAGDVSIGVECTLPKFVVARRKGGKMLWIPKLPQLRFDSDGTVVGVDFIPLDFIHPNDNDDLITGTDFMNLSTISSAPNYRTFAFGDDYSQDEDWKMWDWQTESYYYQGLAANVAERVQLSTHNRPIQTVFPQEIYTRIQKMEPAERNRYLKMMKARVSRTGVLQSSAGSDAKAGEKSMYFPLFLSSTENPSLNFDTRFVEQLDIDVITRDLKDVFTTADVVPQNTSLNSLYEWIHNFRTTVFGGDFTSAGLTTGPAMDTSTLSGASNACTFTPTSGTLLTQLSSSGAVVAYPDSYNAYNLYTPRSYVIDLRSYSTVPQNFVKVEALLYYHNFHDTTAQAIRDSNFKPGTPASLLSYNTYLETPQLLKQSDLQNTNPINVNLTTNNLVFGTTFFVRRRASKPKLASKRDHNMQTLRLKSVALTASGQQLYSSVLDESQITDPFDYDLASGKVGRKYSNALISQAIDDPYTGESFFMYHIPFGFSSDMTYNSGSIAFQTLNNPVLTVQVDLGKDASQPVDVAIEDNEWELVVLHNYWQMIRIDSNTGAITRSLDL
jgi:hypothetical protein